LFRCGKNRGPLLHMFERRKSINLGTKAAATKAKGSEHYDIVRAAWYLETSFSEIHQGRIHSYSPDSITDDITETILIAAMNRNQLRPIAGITVGVLVFFVKTSNWSNSSKTNQRPHSTSVKFLTKISY